MATKAEIKEKDEEILRLQSSATILNKDLYETQLEVDKLSVENEQLRLRNNGLQDSLSRALAECNISLRINNNLMRAVATLGANLQERDLKDSYHLCNPANKRHYKVTAENTSD